jgi:hypothetical protein
MLRTASSAKLIYPSLLTGGLLILLYALLYLYAPFSPSLNDLVINGLIALAAAAAAYLSLRVWASFAGDEAPRRIWGNFALALCMWTAGEVVWAYYAFTAQSVPPLSAADFFYTGAFIFFARAFVHQYQVLNPSAARSIASRTLWICLGVLGVSLLAALLFSRLWPGPQASVLEIFPTVFYPFGDLVLAAAALQLRRIFGRGQWGRVWLALLVFTAADAVYAVLLLTGWYSFAVDQASWTSFAADTLYFSAYILLAAACFSQWALLRFGPSSSPNQAYEPIFEAKG